MGNGDDGPVTIDSCDVSGLTQYGIDSYGEGTQVYSNNTFHDNDWNSWAGAIAMVGGAQNYTIKNNRFYDNTADNNNYGTIVFQSAGQGRVIGKISPVDLLRGLETNYNRINTEKTLSRFGLSYIWKSMQADYNLWENPFKDLCRTAQEVRAKDIVKDLPDGQSVRAEDPLAKCFHLFVMNRHDALFVVEGKQIIGLLRFSDVYKKASGIMKECAI